MIVSYLPEPDTHPLWTDIQRLLKPATNDDLPTVEPNELVWIAFEGDTLFGAGTTVLLTSGEAQILACGGFEHRKWIEQAEALVTRWAKDCGAAKITMRGRRGWARYFCALGWDCSERDGQFAFEKVL